MPDDMLATLQAIDPAVLESVVREDHRSPSFHITDWSVRRLRDKGIMNRDDLWLFRGQGLDGRGARHWSVVLKILNRQAESTSPTDMLYWKRELLVAQSGLTGRLPGPVKTPRFYKAEETPGGAWIWMEHVQDLAADRWTIDNYSFAAGQLGRWSGACSMAPPSPVEPWFARQHYRRWLAWIDNDEAWQFPLNKNRVSSVIRARQDQLWAERESFYAVIERLPQVFSHFGLQRRNLLTRHGEDEHDELVAIDWAQCGLGPLGAELANLIGVSAMTLEWPPADLRELDGVVFRSYLEGLREAGWPGKADMARLGFVAWLAVCVGGMMPGGVASWCSAEYRQNALDQFGTAGEDLFWQYLPTFSYALDCADEARQLVTKLGV